MVKITQRRTVGANTGRRRKGAGAGLLVCASIAITGASCGGAPSGGAGGPTTVSLTKPAPAAAEGAKGKDGDPSDPLTIAAIPRSPPPAWLAPPVEGDLVDDPLGEVEAPSIGAHTAVLSTKAGYFAVDDAVGVIGPLRVPEGTIWVGVAGADDVILAATKDGSLFAAKDASAAAGAGAFASRASVPGAVAWDAAGSMIAAARGSNVSVSSDEGKTFNTVEIAPNLPVLDVFVRADGIAAAIATSAGDPPRKTYISIDKGKSWRPSSFAPIEITRDGGWIWNGSDTCPAVLSKDGQRWTTGVDPKAALDERDSFRESLRLSDTSTALASHGRVTVSDPPPPPPPGPGKAAVGAAKVCKNPSEATCNLIGLIGSNRGRSLLGCQGATCLRAEPAPAPAPSGKSVAIFNDVACDPKDAHPDGLCKAHLRLPRKPTLAILDHIRRSVQISHAPDDCEKVEAVMSAGGIGLLFCSTSGDDTAVFATDAGGSWRAEGRLSAPPSSLMSISMADDGTLMIEADPVLAADAADESPDPPLVAFLRAPKALGEAGAWRRLEAEGAVAFRPLPGGAALIAISPKASAGKRLDLVLSEGPDRARRLASGVEVTANLLGLSVKNGRVVLSARAPFEAVNTPQLPPGEAPSKFIVTLGGRLAPDWK